MSYYKTSAAQREASKKYSEKISDDEIRSQRRRLNKYRANGILFLKQTNEQARAHDFVQELIDIYNQRFSKKK